MCVGSTVWYATGIDALCYVYMSQGVCWPGFLMQAVRSLSVGILVVLGLPALLLWCMQITLVSAFLVRLCTLVSACAYFCCCALLWCGALFFLPSLALLRASRLFPVCAFVFPGWGDYASMCFGCAWCDLSALWLAVCRILEDRARVGGQALKLTRAEVQTSLAHCAAARQASLCFHRLGRLNFRSVLHLFPLTVPSNHHTVR